jgi:predicted adenylyl cyclase CyaB
MDEIEIKFRLDGPAEHERLRVALRALGAAASPSRREVNRLFEDERGSLRAAGAVLRLRVLDDGPDGILTFKGAARFAGAVKSRRELETKVEDAAKLKQLLEALDYREVLLYTKRREAWHLGEVEVALDELVFGHFCEIEGPHDQILALAQRLGLREEQAESAGYPALMARHLATGGIAAGSGRA